ncbi:MAG: hypothetical protein H0Z33_10240 [Bacillaceae bacterium]|nr:hypothetical protein [Bacillaceae bacterium]
MTNLKLSPVTIHEVNRGSGTKVIKNVFVSVDNFCRAKNNHFGYNKGKVNEKGLKGMAKRGRPKSDNPRSFTVPEVRLTKKEMRMFTLKAGFFGGSTAALIRKAVEAYEPRLQKNECCGKEMEVMKEDESFVFKHGNHECKITVKNVPKWRCSKCGEVEAGLSLIAAIEKVVEQEFESRINTPGSQVPDEITLNFDEMLQIKEPQRA